MKDTKRSYGVSVKHNHPNSLDFVSFAPAPVHVKCVDLRYKMPPVYDQGQLGSCTGNGLACLMEYDNKIMASRLFIYYNERVMEGTVNEDSGAEISDGVKCLAKYGVCYESEWPYDIQKFTVKPPETCYLSALKHKALKFRNVKNTLNDMKACLNSGFPFTLGITIFESFESDEAAETGVVPMPKYNEKELGGHCVVCCGYDDNKQVFIMRNSWGDSWGKSGYFTLPYAYLLNSNYTSDLWCITEVQHQTTDPSIYQEPVTEGDINQAPSDSVDPSNVVNPSKSSTDDI